VSKANVDKRIYGGMNHMICQDEFDGIRDMLVSSAWDAHRIELWKKSDEENVLANKADRIIIL